jgi:hypothetical protein
MKPDEQQRLASRYLVNGCQYPRLDAGMRMPTTLLVAYSELQLSAAPGADIAAGFYAAEYSTGMER